MMRNFLAVIATALALGLPACAGFEPLREPVAVTDVSSARQTAQHAIDEANALRVAVNRTIEANARDGLWSREQAQDYLDQSKAVGRRVDEARELLRLGDLSTAQSQAEAARQLLLVLQKAVAEKAREGGVR